MELNFDLTKKDLADFKHFHFMKHIRKRIYFVLIVAFALPFIMNKDRPFDMLVYLSTVVVAGGVFGIIYIGSMYFTITNIMKLPGAKGYLPGRRKFIVRDEGLLETSFDLRKLHIWKTFRSIEEGKNSLYIYTAVGFAYIIPKRSFRDAAAQHEFTRLVESRIKNSI